MLQRPKLALLTAAEQRILRILGYAFISLHPHEIHMAMASSNPGYPSSRLSSFRDKVGKLLSSRRAAAIEIVISLLMLLYLPYATAFLLLLAFISLWSRHKKFGDIGLTRRSDWQRVIAVGVTIAFGWILLNAYIVAPLVQALTGTPSNLSTFNDVQGNIAQFAYWLGITWSLAAFGEEIVFRGYLLCRVMDIFGENAAGHVLGLIITSAIFSLGHLYQGPTGVIDAAVFGAFQVVLFLKGGRNLWLNVIVHGINDTLGFVTLFLAG